jgi:5-methylcytosine-specific restriction endonuclease McrA
MHRRHGHNHNSAHGQPRPNDDPPLKRTREDIDLFDESATPSLVAALAGSSASEGLNSKVLVLNRLYVAIRVVSARRAFCLLMREIAEVIQVEKTEDAGEHFINYDFATWADLSTLQKQFEPGLHEWVRTPRFEIAVPRIIRLLGYDRLPEQTVKLNRRNLFARDRSTCQYCGRHFPTADLSIDHVLPRTQGGGDTWENLVCACIRCNARKGGRTPDQAHMTLFRKPERPKRNPVITLRLGNEKYHSWKAFLDHAYWDVELK